MNHYIKHIIASLLFVNMNVFACQILPSEDYTFNYEYVDGKINYTIKNKDKKSFYILDMNGPSYNLMNGFFFINKQKREKETTFLPFEIDPENSSCVDYMRDYFLEGNTLYSDFIEGIMVSQTYPYPFRKSWYNREYLTKATVLQNQVNLQQWSLKFKDLYPENQKYGEQQVIFQVKIPQDEWAKTCLVFQTKPLAINLPSKIYTSLIQLKKNIGASLNNVLDKILKTDTPYYKKD